MSGTPREDLWSWFERTEIPLDNWWEWDDWATYMEEELGLMEDTRKEALWDFKEDITEELAHAGVYAVEFERYGRREQRWVITGMKGLYGWEKVRSLFPELFEG